MMLKQIQVVKNAIPTFTAKMLAASLLISENKGEMEVDNGQVVGAMITHGNSSLDALMLSLLPVMEEKTGLQLLPTYSFARIYRKGDVLTRHTDRPSCEISTTLTLGYISEEIWQIFANVESGEVGIDLDHGDMLIYRGCEVEHWRNEFEGDLWVQVFLHYVDINGPYTEHAFDKRSVGDLYGAIYGSVL